MIELSDADLKKKFKAEGSKIPLLGGGGAFVIVDRIVKKEFDEDDLHRFK